MRIINGQTVRLVNCIFVGSGLATPSSKCSRHRLMNRLSTGMFLWPSALSKLRGAPSNSPTSCEQSVQSQLFMLLSLLRPAGKLKANFTILPEKEQQKFRGGAMKRQSRPTIGPVEFTDQVIKRDEKCEPFSLAPY